MTIATRPTRLNALYDQQLQPVQLSKAFGIGKEGTVHPVSGQPRLAAKILHRQPVPEETAAKLRYMVDNPPPVVSCSAYRLAWPVDLIRRPKRNGTVVGYLMPQLDQDRYREIGVYFNPLRRRRRVEQRGRPFTFLHLLVMAQNVAHAVAHLHAQGHVVGDLNSRNVLANDRGQVAIIDTDSFQIVNRRDGLMHRCQVGTPEYTPPGLQQAAYADQDRTPDDDCFALAVMIYQLLFQGQHPYAGIYKDAQGDAVTTVAERIGQSTFAHGPQTKVKHRASPADAVIWKDSPLKKQFQTAFRRNGRRVTAEEWIKAIEQAGRDTVQCRRNPRHHRLAKPGSKCTWCSYKKLTGIEPFPQPGETRH